jgi:predicted DNA-binding transcriptional regulator AlpA
MAKDQNGHVAGLTGEKIPWRDRPLLRMQEGSKVSGLSTASLYRAASEGRLTLKRLYGRTLIETPSLIALINSAEDWVRSGRADKAHAARTERSRAAWQP